MEYIQGISTQARLFGQSILIGFALGGLYCVFRFLRYVFGNKKTVCFVADLLYFFISGIAVFFFTLVADGGSLRVYTVFGVALGAAVFYLTTAKVSVRLCKATVRGLKVIFLLIKAPFKFLKRKIIAAYKKMREIYQKRTKKILKKSKNRLQNE